MRTIVVGDIHGCPEELDILLGRVEHQPEDHIIFVGDLIHRGPDSGRVVRMVKELAERRNVTVVEGNHEEKHRRWRKALAEGRADKMRHIEHYPRAEAEMKAAGVQGWLDQPLPLYVRLPEYNSVVLHGGLMPEQELPATEQELAELSAKKLKSLKKILRVRHVSPEGKMVKLGDKTNADVFWPKLYDGRFGHVFFGHHPFAKDAEPRNFGVATSLDLGCVFGGHLAAAVLNGKDAKPEFVKVKALATYSEEWTEEE